MEDDTLATFFLDRSGSAESVFVTSQIMKYDDWLKRKLQPKDSEVNIKTSKLNHRCLLVLAYLLVQSVQYISPFEIVRYLKKYLTL